MPDSEPAFICPVFRLRSSFIVPQCDFILSEHVSVSFAVINFVSCTTQTFSPSAADLTSAK